MDTQHTQDNQSPIVYTVDPSNQAMHRVAAYFFAIGFGIIAPIFIIVISSQQANRDLVGTILVAGLLAGIGVSSTWSIQRWLRETSLRLDAEGLLYQTPGIIIQTGWNNVERLDDHMGNAVLWLRTPAAIHKSFGTTLSQTTSLAGRHVDRRIPLSHFTIWSQSSQLYRDIVRFAPHLAQRPAPARSR